MTLKLKVLSVDLDTNTLTVSLDEDSSDSLKPVLEQTSDTSTDQVSHKVSKRQLSYLEGLGYSGKMPTTVEEADTLIKALKKLI